MASIMRAFAATSIAAASLAAAIACAAAQGTGGGASSGGASGSGAAGSAGATGGAGASPGSAGGAGAGSGANLSTPDVSSRVAPGPASSAGRPVDGRGAGADVAPLPDTAGKTVRCPDGSIGKTNAGGCLGDPPPR